MGRPNKEGKVWKKLKAWTEKGDCRKGWRTTLMENVEMEVIIKNQRSSEGQGGNESQANDSKKKKGVAIGSGSKTTATGSPKNVVGQLSYRW